jgi:hypothetical protein
VEDKMRKSTRKKDHQGMKLIEEIAIPWDRFLEAAFQATSENRLSYDLNFSIDIYSFDR